MTTFILMVAKYVCLSVCLLSVCLSTVCLSVYCLSDCLSVVCLSVCLSLQTAHWLWAAPMAPSVCSTPAPRWMLWPAPPTSLTAMLKGTRSPFTTCCGALAVVRSVVGCSSARELPLAWLPLAVEHWWLWHLLLVAIASL